MYSGPAIMSAVVATSWMRLKPATAISWSTGVVSQLGLMRGLSVVEVLLIVTLPREVKAQIAAETEK